MPYYTWQVEAEEIRGGRDMEHVEYTVLTHAEYENGIKERKLFGLKCRACNRITCPPMPVCQWCGSRNLERTELSGEGELITFTVIRVPPEGFEADVPYIPCLVRTKEGPSVIGRLDHDAEHATQDLLGKLVKLSGSFTKGDKFSGGPHTCPVFGIRE
jgi:hypothetical protein